MSSFLTYPLTVCAIAIQALVLAYLHHSFGHEQLGSVLLVTVGAIMALGLRMAYGKARAFVELNHILCMSQFGAMQYQRASYEDLHALGRFARDRGDKGKAYTSYLRMQSASAVPCGAGTFGGSCSRSRAAYPGTPRRPRS